jgi:(R,R)-butanediol dehydrogenase/meso-butanediol dehydrogenase/diacetyl reductase
MLVQALRAAGARQTYVVEPPKEHRTKALELGAS